MLAPKSTVYCLGACANNHALISCTIDEQLLSYQNPWAQDPGGRVYVCCAIVLQCCLPTRARPNTPLKTKRSRSLLQSTARASRHHSTTPSRKRDSFAARIPRPLQRCGPRRSPGRDMAGSACCASWGFMVALEQDKAAYTRARESAATRTVGCVQQRLDAYIYTSVQGVYTEACDEHGRETAFDS